MSATAAAMRGWCRPRRSGRCMQSRAHMLRHLVPRPPVTNQTWCRRQAWADSGARATHPNAHRSARVLSRRGMHVAPHGATAQPHAAGRTACAPNESNQFAAPAPSTLSVTPLQAIACTSVQQGGAVLLLLSLESRPQTRPNPPTSIRTHQQWLQHRHTAPSNAAWWRRSPCWLACLGVSGRRSRAA
jgi:hypothetical protein